MSKRFSHNYVDTLELVFMIESTLIKLDSSFYHEIVKSLHVLHIIFSEIFNVWFASYVSNYHTSSEHIVASTLRFYDFQLILISISFYFHLPPVKPRNMINLYLMTATSRLVCQSTAVDFIHFFRRFSSRESLSFPYIFSQLNDEMLDFFVSYLFITICSYTE